MKERFEKPRTPLDTESSTTEVDQFPGIIEIASITSSDVVLAALHEETTRLQTTEARPQEDRLEILHDQASHCDCFPLLAKYAKGEVPSIERMFAGMKSHIDDAKEKLEAEIVKHGPDEDIESFLKSLNLLLGRERQIESSIKQYVYSLIRFHQLKLLSNGGTRDLKRQFIDSDYSRHRAHENLLESLSVYGKTLNSLINEGVLSKDIAASWSQGEDARNIDEHKAVLFSDTVIRDRDFVRHWAVVVDFEKQFRALNDIEWISENTQK